MGGGGTALPVFPCFLFECPRDRHRLGPSLETRFFVSRLDHSLQVRLVGEIILVLFFVYYVQKEVRNVLLHKPLFTYFMRFANAFEVLYLRCVALAHFALARWRRRRRRRRHARTRARSGPICSPCALTRLCLCLARVLSCAACTCRSSFCGCGSSPTT
jgi:hypothetical protein